MGILDGFLFISKDERRRRQKDFDNRVFPFGVEAQRPLVEKALSELVDDRNNSAEIQLFAYLSAKDKYILHEKSEKALALAKKEIERVIRKNNRAVSLILSLIQLDSEISSIEDYPSAPAIRAHAAQI
jgi:hypothetical protein